MSTENVTIVIPARYQSSRLPGKPLIQIVGKPMIQHVYEQVAKTRLVTEHQCPLLVATDHRSIVEAVQSFNGRVLLTSEHHKSGTDRLVEVAQKLKLKSNHIIINVQGDEPLIPPQVIDQVADNLKQQNDFAMATLYDRINSLEQFLDPATVKVVQGNDGRALYFSRAPIPMPRSGLRDKQLVALPSELTPKRHIGLYAYRVELLTQFQQWPQSPLEQSEQLEQLRILENNRSIHIDLAHCPVPPSVDTKEQLHQVISLIKLSEP